MSSPSDNSNQFNNILSEISKTQENNQLPPVDQWDPDFCGDMDLVIKRNGSWHYQNSPIGRQRLVKLFSTVLKKENDNYFLVTPVEKLGIKVEDAPFLVTQMELQSAGQEQVITFIDNCDNHVTLDQQHPLWVEQDGKTGEPSPYIMIRKNLHALIHRNVFYQLVEIAEERIIDQQKHLGVISIGDFYSLGTI